MDKKITFAGNPVTLAGTPVKVGDKAPVFTVADATLQPVSSDRFDGKVRIISVFPSIDTPVCSLQTKRFNREAAADLPFAQKRFCAVEGIDRMFVYSDYNGHDFGRKYGFLIRELALLTRGVVVVDREGTVRYAEYVSEITEEPDYAKALDAARALL